MFEREWHSEVGFEPTFLLAQPGVVQCGDHLGGFDQHGFNQALDILEPAEIHVEYVLPDWIKQKYPQHTFKFDAELMIRNNHFEKAISYKDVKQPLVLDNFLCCFNRTGNVGRQWLVEELFKRGWFDPNYCSKCFQSPANHIDVKLHNFRKAIICHSADISETDALANLAELSPLIKSSFINLVSETVPENYVPFPTEKFLFPVLNHRLWLAYAPPGYHKFLSEILGFRLYDDFFDYSFDDILDPKERLNALLNSVEPFSTLTKKAWDSVYKVLEPAIEYNHQWATSGQFIDRIRNLNEVTKSMSIAKAA